MGAPNVASLGVPMGACDDDSGLRAGGSTMLAGGCVGVVTGGAAVVVGWPGFGNGLGTGGV
jgi:hypothetical protein